jgi:metal-responsive CopG/Arc/MetJ family transcriptional regulator
MTVSRQLKPFGTRLEEDLIKEVKVFSTLTDTRVREVVQQALRDYLDKHSKESLRFGR